MKNYFCKFSREYIGVDGAAAIRIITAVLLVLFFAVMNRSKVFGYDEVVVVIDPGHGGEVTGNVDDTNGGAMYHDLIEKDLTLITARALKEELEQYGNVIVYLTRDEDVAMGLDERVDFAKSVDADVFISVHYNASADHNFFGSEIFTSAYGECYATGNGLAQCIMKRWVEDGNIPKDIKTRIGKNGDYYGVIRNSTREGIPSLILEHGYLDNDKDYLRIKSEEAWKNFGVLDARGIADYFGLEKNVFKENVGPTVDVAVPDAPVEPATSGPSNVVLTIDDYNSNKGDVSFTITAYDDYKLMYYGFVTDKADEDTVFEKLELWDGNNGKMSGTYHIRPGYEGSLTATVFNVYQLNTVSNTVELEVDDTREDSPEDDARKNKDSDVDLEEDTLLQEELEETAENVAAEEGTSDNPNGIVVENSALDTFELGGPDKNSVDEAMARAIDKDFDSTVNSSYKKLMIIGFIAALIGTVSLVLLISSMVSRKKRRNSGYFRERKSYDWMDDDDKNGWSNF